jgi:hypothetical protein
MPSFDGTHLLVPIGASICGFEVDGHLASI